MGVGEHWRRFVKRILRRHRDIKSFDHEIRAAGGEAGRVDRGVEAVPTGKIVGSVSRWRNLRSDFFYRHGKAMTERFVRVGAALREGKTLPPLDLYKMKVKRPDSPSATPVTEYYVVDGHHRVAMARKLGQDFLDARVVEYKVDDAPREAPAAIAAGVEPPVEQAPDSEQEGSPKAATPPGNPPSDL